LEEGVEVVESFEEEEVNVLDEEDNVKNRHHRSSRLAPNSPRY
jgi:hypothetical protein